jgi:hypothetical protein
MRTSLGSKSRSAVRLLSGSKGSTSGSFSSESTSSTEGFARGVRWLAILLVRCLARLRVLWSGVGFVRFPTATTLFYFKYCWFRSTLSLSCSFSIFAAIARAIGFLPCARATIRCSVLRTGLIGQHSGAKALRKWASISRGSLL